MMRPRMRVRVTRKKTRVGTFITASEMPVLPCSKCLFRYHWHPETSNLTRVGYLQLRQSLFSSGVSCSRKELAGYSATCLTAEILPDSRQCLQDPGSGALRVAQVPVGLALWSWRAQRRVADLRQSGSWRWTSS